MKRKSRGRVPSHEAIYQYIARDKRAGGTVWQHLPVNSRRRYGKRNRVARGGAPIPNRTGSKNDLPQLTTADVMAIGKLI